MLFPTETPGGLCGSFISYYGRPATNIMMNIIIIMVKYLVGLSCRTRNTNELTKIAWNEYALWVDLIDWIECGLRTLFGNTGVIFCYIVLRLYRMVL